MGFQFDDKINAGSTRSQTNQIARYPSTGSMTICYYPTFLPIDFCANPAF